MATAAALIRDTRIEVGLTQAELAERMGAKQSVVARLERAGSNPTVATLERALESMGRRLALDARHAAPDLDEEQIRAHVAMTPAERVRAHDAAYRGTRRLLRRGRLA